ncbi:MAG: type II and III secretion system family protein [Proteobacteria bacterium]|nr:MAG: type II and III secretion system family protein [Pseudomonadota bacterium]
MRNLLAFLFIFWSWMLPSYAATETIGVYFMPLHEAAQAVKTQLSSEGKVIEINSKRMLLIDDKAAYIKKAKSLLKKLDRPAAQLTVQLKIENMSSLQESSVAGSISMSPLSGGWVQLAVGQKSQRVSNRSSYQLRVSANQPGRIETGTIQSFSRETRRWLSAYGVVEERSIALIPITAGFYVRARLVGNGLVHVRIIPWMKRATHSGLNDNQDVLVGLGANVTPAIPDSYLRYNSNPKPKRNRGEISIAGAATELTIALGEEVSIAAVDHEAEQLGKVLLGRYSNIGKRQFVIRLKVSD